VAKEMNKKCRPKNMMVQLSTSYTDPERHNAQRHRETDDSMMPIVDHTV